MLKIYASLMSKAEPVLNKVLENRLSRGKENTQRLSERKGIASRERPSGRLVWLHAASVGEAQSALILINSLLKQFSDLHVLVTTGTTSSAARMEESLPDRAFHQFVPLDHPDWVARFLDHWKPDAVFWMESELWPNTLLEIKARNIPSALVNARLSERSLSRWKLIKNSITELLSAFNVILAQSELDAQNLKSLGAANVFNSGNLKYSADPLPYEVEDFKALSVAIGNRPVIVYASTHAGEEEIAAETHSILENEFSDLLSIIIPRHPERGQEIADKIQEQQHGVILRGNQKTLPDYKTRIYIANTLGELGLFYRLSEITYVGRSLSDDGGGGHNPLEPALLNCAVLHGKNIQNLADIYYDMQAANACLGADNADELRQNLEMLLSNDAYRSQLVKAAHDFANDKSHVIDIVMEQVSPLLEKRSSNAS